MSPHPTPSAAPVTNLDEAIGFTLPHRHARGRLVRIGPVLDRILAAHEYPAPIARILSEALTLTALLGAMLKDAGGQLTMQAQTEAGSSTCWSAIIAAASCAAMCVRQDRLVGMPSLPTRRDAVWQGLSCHHLDQIATRERYQGIVPLEGASLAEAAQSFFAQSSRSPAWCDLRS
jgi:molecular chaperone Hsp33